MLELEKGDFGYEITFTCQKSDGSAFDLTGYTVTFNVWEQGAPGTILLAGACSIISAIAGTCKYTVATGNFDSAGAYRGEIQATKTGVKQSFIPFSISVIESA